MILLERAGEDSVCIIPYALLACLYYTVEGYLRVIYLGGLRLALDWCYWLIGGWMWILLVDW